MEEISLLAPVQMVDHKIVRLICLMNDAFNPDLEESSQYSIQFNFVGQNEIALPNLEVGIVVDYAKDNEGCKYSHISVYGVGRFLVHHVVPTDQIRTYAIPSATNLLYGALRGFLTTVTASFGGGAVILPALNPQHFIPTTEPTAIAPPPTPETAAKPPKKTTKAVARPRK